MNQQNNKSTNNSPIRLLYIRSSVANLEVLSEDESSDHYSMVFDLPILKSSSLMGHGQTGGIRNISSIGPSASQRSRTMQGKY